MNPWICPKCQRVYGPVTMECYPCNKEINDGAEKSALPPGLQADIERFQQGDTKANIPSAWDIRPNLGAPIGMMPGVPGTDPFFLKQPLGGNTLRNTQAVPMGDIRTQ